MKPMLAERPLHQPGCASEYHYTYGDPLTPAGWVHFVVTGDKWMPDKDREKLVRRHAVNMVEGQRVKLSDLI